MVLTEVDYKLTDGVATLTLNRPERRNAMTMVMLAELIYALEACTDNQAVRVVVLRGADKGFCPGDDLSGMGPLPDNFASRPQREVTHAELQAVLRELEKPTVAAIHGFAFGVGLDLAMACDFRIAEASAVLRDQRVIERGMHAVTGCAWFHPRVMGVARALEFLILGEPLTGEQAAAIGMVTRVAPADTFDEVIDTFADRLAKAPTKAIGLMKRQIYEGLQMTHADFMAFAGPLIHEVEIRDRKEGIQAFLEKREPKFTGE